MKLQIIVIAILLVGCASRKESENSKKAEIYYAQGTQSLLDKKYTEALTSLIKAIELDPENSNIHNNLGMAYYLKKDKASARKYFEKSLEIDEKNCDARGNIASLLMEEGDIAGAETNYKKMLEDLTYEKHARTYYNLGIIQLRKKDINEAHEYFTKSTQEDSGYCPSYMQLGFIDFKNKKYKDALKNFKEASMGTCVRDPLPYYHQAITYLELKNFGMARLKLSEVEAMNIPNDLARLVNTKISELASLEADYKAENLNAARQSLDQSPEF